LSGEEVVKSWLETIAALNGRRLEGPKTVPDDYLTIFPVQVAVTAGVTESELVEFLVKAFRSYCKIAAAADVIGWFYAWFDEVSGTLRCSMAAVEEVQDLPFACRLKLSDEPREVCKAALDSRYLAGIPNEELETIPWTEPYADRDSFVLSVFARPIVHAF